MAAAGAVALPACGQKAIAPVLMVRHAQTAPGIGDPPGFTLERCATQRNLAADGRAQAQAFGARLASLGLQPTAILSSRWCRCLHTAEEIRHGLGASGVAPAVWPALDSFFDYREREGQQTALLRERLAAMRGPGFEVWVSHQVNIAALTGVTTQMGQALWVRHQADDSIVALPFE
jgi:broad specificity phosphatase PhoE